MSTSASSSSSDPASSSVASPVCASVQHGRRKVFVDPVLASVDPDDRLVSLEALPELFATLAVRRVFLVCDRGAYQFSGAAESLAGLFGDRDVEVFDRFTPNPKDFEIDDAIAAMRRFGPDIIVAVGGGSGLDVAKLSRACDVAGVSARDVICGKVAANTQGVRLLAVPTTSGTGSEATHFSAVYVDGKKYSLADQSMRPEHVLLEPRFTESLPASVTLASGLDATCQAIESMWSVKSTDASRAYAERALQLAWHALPECLLRPTAEARRRMMIAAHLAGRAINLGQTTACHAMSYTLTAKWNIPHGQAVALMLEPVWHFTADAESSSVIDPRGRGHLHDVMLRVCRVIGAHDLRHARDRIVQMLHRLGTPINFSEAKIPARDAVDLISQGIDPVRMGNHPVRITPEDAVQILEPLC